jgi:signal transduction histidine kinase
MSHDAPRGGLILHIDPDTNRRHARSHWLRRAGLRVLDAEDTPAGLALTAHQPPELILLDDSGALSGPNDLESRIRTSWPTAVVIRTAAAPDILPVGSATPPAAGDATAELERRVAARTSELAAANQRLRAEIAERTRTEEQLRQAQKIEALGHLTAGIAHDFNNLLTAILGGLEVIRRRIDDPRTLRLIDSSTSAAERGAKLIEQLMAFARKQKLNVEAVDLNQLVSEMTEKLQRVVGSAVGVVLALEPGAWPVLADPGQVRMALLNLSVNARDTMESGGALLISTGNVTVAAADASPALQAGDYGALCVRDSGPGMSEEALAHLFEPFFTTKDVGKGSGMGLAQVYGFVRQSQGDVQVSSSPGQGTSLTILLPRAPEPAPSTAP